MSDFVYSEWHVWLWKTQLDILWPFMTLNDSFRISFTNIYCVQLWFDSFSYCSIPFNCLNMFKVFNFFWNCSTHAVMNKFCGSKWIKWFEKAQKRVNCSQTMLKKSWLCIILRTYAQILCLFFLLQIVKRILGGSGLFWQLSYLVQIFVVVLHIHNSYSGILALFYDFLLWFCHP